MHTIAELLKVCEWWCVINQISNSISDTKGQVVELSLGYITAATLNKINHLTFKYYYLYNRCYTVNFLIDILLLLYKYLVQCQL